MMNVIEELRDRKLHLAEVEKRAKRQDYSEEKRKRYTQAVKDARAQITDLEARANALEQEK